MRTVESSLSLARPDTATSNERIIRAFAVTSEDLIGELLRRRLGREAVGESLPDAVGGEDERIAGGNGEDKPGGAAHSDPTMPPRVTRPARASRPPRHRLQQQAFDVADPEPRHGPVGSAEHRDTHQTPRP